MCRKLTIVTHLSFSERIAIANLSFLAAIVRLHPKEDQNKYLVRSNYCGDGVD